MRPIAAAPKFIRKRIAADELIDEARARHIGAHYPDESGQLRNAKQAAQIWSDGLQGARPNTGSPWKPPMQSRQPHGDRVRFLLVQAMRTCVSPAFAAMPGWVCRPSYSAQRPSLVCLIVEKNADVQSPRRRDLLVGAPPFELRSGSTGSLRLSTPATNARIPYWIGPLF
jgi:hypothetical protein